MVLRITKPIYKRQEISVNDHTQHEKQSATAETSLETNDGHVFVVFRSKIQCRVLSPTFMDNFKNTYEHYQEYLSSFLAYQVQ